MSCALQPVLASPRIVHMVLYGSAGRRGLARTDEQNSSRSRTKERTNESRSLKASKSWRSTRILVLAVGCVQFLLLLILRILRIILLLLCKIVTAAQVSRYLNIGVEHRVGRSLYVSWLQLSCQCLVQLTAHCVVDPAV